MLGAVLALVSFTLGCPLVEPHVDDPVADDTYESLRRYVEGGVETSADHARVEVAIAAIERDLGGTASHTLAERMAAHRVPGVSVAVVHGGAVEWVEAWGVYDSDADTPMLRLAPLQAASISKVVTALALLHLVEEEELELDAPLNDSLSSWSIPESPWTALEPVTLRRVLSHTAGFNNSGFVGYAPGADVPTLHELLEGQPPANHPAIRVQSTPGSRWSYSGGGYAVLAQVVEDVTRRSFDVWLRGAVLERADMHGSHFEQPWHDPRVEGVRIGSVLGQPVAPFTYPELSAAGLWSNALDLGRLVVAIQRALAGEDGAVLAAGSAARMIAPQAPGPGFFDIGGPSYSPRMGLGVFLAGGDDPGWFWHSGSNVGFNCLIVGDTRGGGHGVAVMSNAWPGGIPLAWEIANGVAAVYGWPGWDE